MGANPYTNEPGYEDAKSDEDIQMQDAYIDKVFCLSLASNARFSNHSVDSARNYPNFSYPASGRIFRLAIVLDNPYYARCRRC